jgi:uncharacterized protein (DUF2126 family)/transglutaminase-like putative cysteine protease
LSIQVALHHRTEYRYDRPIALGPQTVRLRPAPHCRTPILAYALKVEPEGHFLNWQQDPQSNFLARLVFPEKTDRFSITIDLVADMAVINPFDFFLDPAAESFPFAYDHILDEELAPYRKAAPAGALLRDYLRTIPKSGARTIDFLVDLNRRLQQEITYLIRMEPGVQTPEETLQKKSGSCRDSGWLLVQILRHLGFAARFVSGYLIQLVPDLKPITGPAGPSADFTDLHAWCEVYLPGAGWVGLDPTSGLLAGEGHIPLACSPEPQSAAPISGLTDKAEVSFGFDMAVTRFAEAPRITKPYTPETWNALLYLGERVDEELEENDVRLTMGGEPTFVAADDPDGAEWNTAALGPTKRAYAGRLIRKLADRFSPGCLLHYGQGKWYPGEQLPRWALGCYWRRDGEPVWRERDLLASDDETFPGLDAESAGGFIRRLAERLQVDPGFCIPGYEDAWYYLWRERRLPTNVDPLKSELKDPLERARLARVFEQGLDTVVGYTLPLTRVANGDGSYWKSGPWFLRPETLYLIPGDSPMGFRLPLDSLPWVAEADYPYVMPADPMEERPALPAHAAFRKGGNGASRNGVPLGQGRREQKALPPLPGESDPSVVRTALCAEVRDGRLHIFMPPLQDAEDYLDLVAAIEDVAAEQGQPVMIEGYHPPQDPRIAKFTVTPDPGVIEVNIHPAHTWDELTDITQGVYADARSVGLVAEKFMLDGRHVGTGGGNHVVLGGDTAADSPLLRRPDLLRSLVGYWHNHPSLSYLFSGLFIGPTSQHPRIDEARDDSTYELEIAFQALERAEAEGGTPPWLADRIFRDVLVDITGNTHRTEFCIDKLFSPDSSSGRLGLLELRAFEMPPDAKMSLAQQLLVRALLAWFWREPYDRKPARYGTRLHDEFMLPHFCALDFADVLDDLKRAGYPFPADAFTAHQEFRFPIVGKTAYRGIELELRQALEPWHVLGEDPAAGGTVRNVDSSLERLQVKITGATAGKAGDRHVLLCNGRVVPLRATGTQGEYVAGVRYRAWQPPRALHPTLPVDTPLVFDLYDHWNARQASGFTYHVSHPGGRNFERFPINANEAETRRRARFFPFGSAEPGLRPLPTVPAGEHPVTLDLRHMG